ncbi:MAG: isocitrate/isopropylmalate dehydrogenase family protein [Janthinobacterium lividum]
MTDTAHHVAILPGDGIGHEVTEAATRIMLAAAARHGVRLTTQQHECGAFHYQRTGAAIAPETMAAIGQADAVLFGAAGWPEIRGRDGVEIAPQIDIREHYALFAGLRPVRLYPGVPGPLARAQVDMLVIREQTEGLFAGRHDPAGNDPDSAQDRMVITRRGCERLFELAFDQARRRRAMGKPGHVTLFDKANVLRGMALMRRIFDEVAERHPDIPTSRVYIDAACMQMVTDPGRFDVIVMENQFGDIVSEIAAGLVGGLGIAPSADIGAAHAVFQPSHGTAPDIAGQGLANPVAAILSAAMLFDWLAERRADPACHLAAESIRTAVAAVLREGPRGRDLGGSAGTGDVTAAIEAAL